LTSRIKDEIYTDVLTGLQNRRAFYDYYDAVREKVRDSRSPGVDSVRFHLILIFADIDFFKKYNDHYGHDAGDECLKRVGGFLSESFGAMGLNAYRIGGEEFLLCGTVVDSELKRLLSNDILKSWQAGGMKLPIEHHQSPFQKITLSGGLVSVEQEKIYSSNAAGITKLADELLYKSKVHRNTLSLSDSLMISYQADDNPALATHSQSLSTM
jgi:diguanylate cyclase (GGDEF)-like protein